MDSSNTFSGRANNYTFGRPDYPVKLIEALYSDYGVSTNSIIADIGSGTGKFSRQLLDKGSTVICVEPNDDMRLIAEKELSSYSNFRSVKGTYNATSLKNESVDFITSAQAFHWFDELVFKEECNRILRSMGKVALVWNVRDMTFIINKECYKIYKKYCPNFKGFSGGIELNDERIKRFFDNNYKLETFDNPLYYTKDKFISRCLSGSYSLNIGEKLYDEYIAKLCGVFDKYSNNGVLKMDNFTVMYLGMI